MAVYKIFPEKDATLYSFYPYMNTGIDAIIECVNINVNINPVPQVSRFLVAFDQDEINSVIDNEIGNQMFSSSLRTNFSGAEAPEEMPIVSELSISLKGISFSECIN